MTGLNESTVRVHLFRAARKLRGLLGGNRDDDAAAPHRTTPLRVLSRRARGEALDPQAARSPADCARLRAPRYAELVAFMDGMRQRCRSAKPTRFSRRAPARAAAADLARLEQAHRSARVISFPGGTLRPVTTRPALTARGSPPRPPPVCSSAWPSAASVLSGSNAVQHAVRVRSGRVNRADDGRAACRRSRRCGQHNAGRVAGRRRVPDGTGTGARAAAHAANCSRSMR